MPHATRFVPLGLCLALCAGTAAAQDAPEPAPQAPPDAGASMTPQTGRVGAPVVGTLGESRMLSIREASALPPDSVLEADASSADAPIIREMVRDEALHRDRVARIRRLRQLAVEQGRSDRLAALERLERTELQRHETRALMARTRLSEPGFQATEGFLRRGGILRLRQAQRSGAELRTAQRTPGRAGARMVTPSRTSLGGSRARPSAGNGTTRSGGGRRGGRSPR